MEFKYAETFWRVFHELNLVIFSAILMQNFNICFDVANPVAIDVAIHVAIQTKSTKHDLQYN